MIRYSTLATIVALLGVVFSNPAASADRPNVVMILADDQGWGDLSLHGNTNLNTPNLDTLAQDGATFDRFFVCSVCAPTRAEMLTGRYYTKTGVSGVSTGRERLNPDEVTLADTLRSAGYRTGAFGKWHNGSQPPYHPNDRGFEEYYGFTSGHWGLYFDPPLDHNNRRVVGEGYLVDDLTDHAIDFIEQHREEPFFCYVPYNTPHSPMQVPDRFYKKFAGAKLDKKHRDPQREDEEFTRAALAMVENIDWNVGRLLETIDDCGLREKTIVIYFSDNGPNSWRWNGGMKGRKGSIDEGGLRVPCMFRWPGKIEPGLKIDPIAGAIDFLPTLCDLTGSPMISDKPIDGVSLRPLLMGSAGEWPDRELLTYFRSAGVRTQRFRMDGKGKLFDIQNDPGQRTPVNKKFPEVAARLKQLADDHAAESQALIKANAERPFTVGYGKRTFLPARDATTTGPIERSARAPNNSYFRNWKSTAATVNWKIEVAEDATFEVNLRYTCRPQDVGVKLQLAAGAHAVEAQVTEPHDPPALGKDLDRADRGTESYVKFFQPLSLGRMKLDQGEQTLTLKALEMPGEQAIEVHSVELIRVDGS